MKIAPSLMTCALGTNPRRLTGRMRSGRAVSLIRIETPEQDAAERPAARRRSPDRQQGRDDRGRLDKVDARRGDQAPDQRRRDQPDRGSGGAARPREEPAEPDRPGQPGQPDDQGDDPGAGKRVTSEHHAAGCQQEAIHRRASKVDRPGRIDGAMTVEDGQADVEVARIVGGDRRPATEADAEHRKHDQRGDEPEPEPVFPARASRRQARHASDLSDRSPRLGEPPAAGRATPPSGPRGPRIHRRRAHGFGPGTRSGGLRPRDRRSLGGVRERSAPEPLGDQPEQGEQHRPAAPKFAHASPMIPGAA